MFDENSQIARVKLMAKIFNGLANWRSATTGGAGAIALATATQLVGGQITWAESLPQWVLVACLALWPELQHRPPTG